MEMESLSQRFPLGKNRKRPSRMRCFFVDHLCYFRLVFCFVFVRVCLLVPCGHLPEKGLTSWLLFVMSNCEVATFLLVSWVRCGA